MLITYGCNMYIKFRTNAFLYRKDPQKGGDGDQIKKQTRYWLKTWQKCREMFLKISYFSCEIIKLKAFLLSNVGYFS